MSDEIYIMIIFFFLRQWRGLGRGWEGRGRWGLIKSDIIELSSQVIQIIKISRNSIFTC